MEKISKKCSVCFYVDGSTCDDFNSLVDEYVEKQKELAEEFIKRIDSDEKLKQSEVGINILNDWKEHTDDYENCNIILFNKALQEKADSNKDENTRVVEDEDRIRYKRHQVFDHFIEPWIGNFYKDYLLDKHPEILDGARELYLRDRDKAYEKAKKEAEKSIRQYILVSIDVEKAKEKGGEV